MTPRSSNSLLNLDTLATATPTVFASTPNPPPLRVKALADPHPSDIPSGFGRRQAPHTRISGSEQPCQGAGQGVEGGCGGEQAEAEAG